MLPYLQQDFPEITLGMASVRLLLIPESHARLAVVHDALFQLMHGKLLTLEKREDMRIGFILLWIVLVSPMPDRINFRHLRHWTISMIYIAQQETVLIKYARKSIKA